MPVDSKPALQPQVRRRLLSVGCLFFLAFGLMAAVSFGLFFFLAMRKAPFWQIAVGFFAPFVLFVAVLAVLGRRFLANVKRYLPSPERAAARGDDTRKSSRTDGRTGDPETHEATGWPTVPDREVIPLPGGALEVPEEGQHPACVLGCLIPFAAVWLTGVGYFGRVILEGHRRGQPDWFQTLFILPFAFAGLVLVLAILWGFFRLVVRLLVGRVRLEISRHPLVAGGRYEVYVEQSGTLALRDVLVTLACQEAATYRRGTNTVTDKKEVFSLELTDSENDGGAADLAGGLRRTLAVPPGAMHSFASQHNKITWRVVVSGRAAGLLPFRAEYPVIVYPAGAEVPA
jgi:hypothetical protein